MLLCRNKMLLSKCKGPLLLKESLKTSSKTQLVTLFAALVYDPSLYYTSKA